MVSIKGVPQKELHRMLHSIISREVETGLYSYDRAAWQKFWNTDLRKIDEFKGLNYNADTDLIEVTSLFAVTSLLNEVHKLPGRFMAASQQGGDENEIKVLTGRQSWDGFIVDTEQPQPIATPVEQKTGFYNLDMELSGTLSQEFDKFIKDIKSRDKLNGEKCFWIFNISPETAEGKTRRLQVDEVLESIHNAKDDIIVGAICFYELTDSQTLSVYCILFPDKDRVSQLNINNIHKYMRIIRFKNEKVPQLRFPNFIGEWQSLQLGEIGKTYNGLAGKSGEDFGSGSLYIQYKQIFDNSRIQGEFGKVMIMPNEKQNKAQYGDIFFTTSSETPEETGYTSVLLDKIDDLYLNSFCFGYRTDHANLLPEFAQYLFHSSSVRRKIVRLAQGSTRYNISKSAVMKLSISMPGIEEQQKIAEFLTAVDDKISAIERKVEKLETYKHGMMQKIFSQQIRFTRDDGSQYPEWHREKLGNYISDLNKKTTNENEYPVMTSSRKGIVLQTEYYGDENRITDRSSLGYYIIPPGYLTYRSRSDDGVFRFNMNSTDKTGSVSYFYPVFSISGGVEKFFEEYLNYHWRIFYKHSVGTSQKVLAHNELKKIELMIPKPIEQQKIADYLSALDQKITLTRDKLDKTKEFKKGLLQRMFV